MRGGSRGLGAITFLWLACARGSTENQAARDSRDGLDIVDDVAARAPELAAIAGRASTFAPGSLTTRLPDGTSAAFSVAIGPGDASIRVTLVGAEPRAATMKRDRAVYARALSSTDRVLSASARDAEELLVLHDARAPRSFAWRIELPREIALVSPRAADHGGGLAFRDARGAALVTMDAPRAWDARGEDVPLDFSWDATANTMRVTLASDATVAFPVVVDPRFETGVWRDVTPGPGPRDTMLLTADASGSGFLLYGGYMNGFVGDTWTHDGAHWHLRSPATVPTTRSGAAAARDEVRSEVVMFGGMRRSDFNDVAETWTWDGTNWHLRTPAHAPPARSGAAMVWDAARGRAVLYGGYDDATVTYFNDTWTWDGTDWTAVPSPQSPPTRAGFALAYDRIRQRTVLFGATTASETWTWNGAAWSRLAPASQPSARGGCAAAWDAARGVVLLYGGGDNVGTPFNDTWAWNGSTWTQLVGDSINTGARQLMGVASSASGVMLFGGTLTNFADTGETWFHDTSWTQAPAARESAGVAFDAERSNIVMFGGSASGIGSAADTWTWDGSDWTKRTPSRSPPAREGLAMTYDAVRKRVVLFSGRPAGTNDTWTWDGSNWTQMAPTTSPPARLWSQFAFDSAHGNSVLFSGFSDVNLLLEDTWIWDGTNWSQVRPSTSPPARFHSGLVYDAARSNLVLFGGAAIAGGFLNDTWIWTGSTWTELHPLSAPTPRDGFGFAYDALSSTALLFGGETGLSVLDDTWAWDGSTWTRRAFAGAFPSARIAPVMAYDAARDNVVLFSGLSPTFQFADTWVQRSFGTRCTSSTDCAFGAVCTDGVCCNASACGTCETCNGTSPGHCTPVTNREDPDSCALSDRKSCSDFGECKAALGVSATRPQDCASGFTVDGVCCSTASCGTCDTCDAAQKNVATYPGQCGPARVGTDPHNDCPDDGPASCHRDGLCDGASRCRLYGHGVSCGTSQCLANRATGQVCTGDGTCTNDSVGVECAPTACANGGCGVTCRTNADCAPLYHCESGACLADRGAVCGDDHTLVSANGSPVNCGLYRCSGAACLNACTNKNDCVGDADCTADHVCALYIRSASAPTDAGGCSLPGSGAPRDMTALFALALVGATSRARRRQVR